MRGKVIVRDGEDIGLALQRLQREVCRDRASDKWPVWRGHYAKPSQKRRRKEWLRALKRKLSRIWQKRRRNGRPK